ncbi:metal-dependent transcriptional regulator [Corynebacterium sp.]|uniref:metal-dependent transcriptional regulator n=1 Tax=Corynebacterium sp. TaxID=1720 RepID=UPI0026DB4F8E|nr:metal-dependent transcriptional regulator [Corynebacterium sp.]MDO5032400.1 metal-dependent transcriptional regulator [Corynebacterium sp.]
MHLSDLPERTQDYLKVLWDLSELSGGKPVALKDVAGRLEQKVPTASEAIKRLAAQGLVVHERYAGMTLSEQGRALAIQMVRRHRLMETFLVNKLGYSWDEVHEDADRLEHACSDRFIERIDELLGFPTRDPHGDPIPNPGGEIEDLGTLTLDDAPLHTPVTIERVSDEDPELLRYLDRFGVAVGEALTVESRVAGLLSVRAGSGEFSLAEVAARAMTVSLA